MNDVKISVCISVHNTEKYLPRCLESVLAQTMQDIEIVLVNNGSTDNSEAIMRQYQQNHPGRCIRIFSQDDRGLAQGRQTGVDNARGDFIAFLDADDLVKPTTFEVMYKAALENEADIVEIETERDGKIISSPYEGTQNTSDVLKGYLEYANIPTMLWLRIYRRELFENPVLPKLYTNNEDNFALPCLLYAARRICYLKEALHIYSTDNENAVMTVFQKKDKGIRYYENRKKTLQMIPHVENYIGKEVIERELKNQFAQYKFRVITGFFFASMQNISFETRMRDVLEAFPGETENSILAFVRRTARKDCCINRLIKLLGLKGAYFIYSIKEKIREKVV